MSERPKQGTREIVARDSRGVSHAKCFHAAVITTIVALVVHGADVCGSLVSLTALKHNDSTLKLVSKCEVEMSKTKALEKRRLRQLHQ